MKSKIVSGKNNNVDDNDDEDYSGDKNDDKYIIVLKAITEIIQRLEMLEVRRRLLNEKKNGCSEPKALWHQPEKIQNVQFKLARLYLKNTPTPVLKRIKILKP